MWKVFPKVGLLKVLFSIFSALFLTVLIIVVGGDQGAGLTWGDFGAAFRLATPITLIFIGFIYVVGKWGWLFLWKAPILGRVMHASVCPNLNGKWLGKIQSSYRDADGNNAAKDVELTIKADIFGFDISLRSSDGYQDSKVIQSELYKDPRTNTFYLSYIFEASVPIPDESDDRAFEGAAKLEIIVSAEDTVLKGTYWTNRAWQRGKNTAGVLTITRENS
ncbi:Cap15 family cyclic dinucleotide receptor domain-containing protein [Teredinibacter franksiae]|uniref:Cap15 family cyclic dinucleotide receptor domain-containing protein n=1 Tax=Teredinibacter franksiae TaxID=2761453 RepID=UPI00162483E1|nr:hypothetical protein [Teredinibacter franksiae]